MNLKHVNDQAILAQTDRIAQEDHNRLAILLHHLREIESRRLYSTLGYRSLFEYVVKRLKYSEDEACRRISAMRLLKEVPQVEEKIKTGELSLTNLSMAQSLFRREEKADRGYSKPQKIQLLRKLENKTSREAEKEIAIISPEPIHRDRVRPISEDKLELKIMVDLATMEKLERLKGILAHKYPDISLGELVSKLADQGLQAWDKSLPAAPRVHAERARAAKPISRAATYREVWRRDKACCKCGSVQALEVDHIVPRAMGGDSQASNLRLLCRKCNQRAAIEIFGREKMGKYLKSRVGSYLTG